MFFKCIIVALFFDLAIATIANYDFRLDMGTPGISCPEPDYKCSDGKVHYLCERVKQREPSCICNSRITLNNSEIRSFVRTANGIRNKVSETFGISNMNIVYWSKELSEMAARYLLECTTKDDPCGVIGTKKLILSQNMALSKQDAEIEIPTLPGRTMRHWYMEIGQETEWDAIKEKILLGEYSNFTNMIYPLNEFMGCAAVELLYGFFIKCYFYPAYNKSNFDEDFQMGDSCSACKSPRTECSKTFQALCGVDFENQVSNVVCVTLNVLCLFFCFLLIFM